MATKRHEICSVTELPLGSRRIVEIGYRSIGVFNVDGRFYAVRNRCPHQGAPLCRGTLAGTMLPSAPGEYRYGLEGRVLRCPWHSWEFDVTTGEMVFVPDPMRVKTYTVTVEPPALEMYAVEVEDQMVVLYV